MGRLRRLRSYPNLDVYFRAVRRGRDVRTPRTMMELANAVGISYSYVAMIRAGHRMPRLDIALRIHAVTGVDLEGLVTNQFEAA